MDAASDVCVWTVLQIYMCVYLVKNKLSKRRAWVKGLGSLRYLFKLMCQSATKFVVCLAVERLSFSVEDNQSDHLC